MWPLFLFHSRAGGRAYSPEEGALVDSNGFVVEALMLGGAVERTTRGSWRTSVGRFLSVSAALCLGSGCQGGTSASFENSRQAAAATISHATEIQPIWDRDCVSCHIGHEDGRLDLTPPNAMAHLLGQASQVPRPIVVPGDVNQSYLHHKLRGTHNTGGVGGGGNTMPIQGLLDQSSLDLVDAWIEGGALP